MTRSVFGALAAGSLFMLAGCGDGSLEIKTKNNNPPNTVIIEKPHTDHTVVVEKPVIIEKNTPTRETSRTTVTTPDGTTRTKETTIKQ